MIRVLQLVLISLSLFLAQASFAEKSFNEMLNEFLKEAPSLKDSAVQQAENPAYQVSAQINGYTDQPNAIGHYHEDKIDTVKMEQEVAKIAELGVETDSKENAGQTVMRSFKTRPVYKLTREDPDIAKAKHVEEHAKEHNKLGVSNRGKCAIKKTIKCEETHTEKTCTEQVRALVKVCEKAPKISISTRAVVYPNCQNLIITQHFNNHCPSGYGSLLYSDMVRTRGDDWDDIRLCTKTISVNESLECFSGGYYITTIEGNKDAGRITVPKKLHARIRMSNVYFNYIVGTIINETTGQTLYSNSHFTNGQVIELPYSTTQDQTFRFYAVQKPVNRGNKPGVMVLYVDHTYREKIANVESWEEINCREI